MTLHIIGTILPVFIIIAAGFLYSRFKKISLSDFNDIQLYVTTPCLVLASLLQNKIQVNNLLMIAASQIILTVGLFFICLLFYYDKPHIKQGMTISSIFMNSGYMGIPIVVFAFGKNILQYAVLVYLMHSILHFSFGVAIAAGGKRGVKEIFKFPLLYITAFGLYLNLTNSIQLIPSSIMQPIELLGQAAIPMMLFSLGAILTDFKPTELLNSLIGSLIRIGGGFFITSVFVKALDIPNELGRVIVLQSSMPSAILNIVLAEKYDSNPPLVASTILISTIISIFTTALILTII